MAGRAFFDFPFTNREELFGNVKVASNLGDSNCEVIEFKILRKEGRRAAERKTKESVSPLLNAEGNLITDNGKKAFNAFFTSVFLMNYQMMSEGDTKIGEEISSLR